MGKGAVIPKEARALNTPEDYYQAKQRQQARQQATYEGDGGMAAKSAPRGVGSYENVMGYLAQGQAAAEAKYGYTLDSSGHRTTAPGAPRAAAPPPAAPAAPPPPAAPVAAPVIPDAVANDSGNFNMGGPTAPLTPEQTAADGKRREIVNQQTQQTAIDEEARRRAEAARRRGRGIGSFLTTGFQGVQQSALAKLLGA